MLLQFLRRGDTLMVTRVDRLARSIKNLQDIVHELRAAGVSLKATEQPIDTSTVGLSLSVVLSADHLGAGGSVDMDHRRDAVAPFRPDVAGDRHVAGRITQGGRAYRVVSLGSRARRARPERKA